MCARVCGGPTAGPEPRSGHDSQEKRQAGECRSAGPVRRASGLTSLYSGFRYNLVSCEQIRHKRNNIDGLLQLSK